tara:strand:- start:1313 stop:1687 length:375 start_codon:yes stop_codon:yes gene_type:complete
MVTGAGLLCPVLLLLAAGNDTSFTTKASWYGKPNGKGGYVDCGTVTAYGKRYDSSKLVCASWEFPEGTKLKVSLGKTKHVIVEVVDKGPGRRLSKERRIDLSLGAFSKLCSPSAGLIKVTVQKI